MFQFHKLKIQNYCERQFKVSKSLSKKVLFHFKVKLKYVIANLTVLNDCHEKKSWLLPTKLAVVDNRHESKSILSIKLIYGNDCNE